MLINDSRADRHIKTYNFKRHSEEPASELEQLAQENNLSTIRRKKTGLLKGTIAGIVAFALSYNSTFANQYDPNLDLPVWPEFNENIRSARLPPDDGDDPNDEPPPIFFGEEIESENDTIVYVIDTSGSMKPGRLTRAQREAKRSIEGLSPNIRFNIVSYSCSNRRLWPELRSATDSSKAEACVYLDSLNAAGGTGTGPATALGLSDKEVEAIALLTDGGPNCGANGLDGHRTMINNVNSQRATINVFGISASGDYRTFCINVAGDSGGSYYDVP